MEEIEISELEFRETLSGDDLIPVETSTNTFATTLTAIKNWLSSFFVGKTGNETIGGLKSFTTTIRALDTSGIEFYSQNSSTRYGFVRPSVSATSLGVSINGVRIVNGSTVFCGVDFTILDDGTKQALLGYQPPVTSDVTSRQLATTGWVNTRLGTSIPDYANQVLSAANATSYTAPSDGFVCIKYTSNNTNTNNVLKINNKEVFWTHTVGDRAAYTHGVSPLFKVEKNAAITVTWSGTDNNNKIIFYPLA